MAISKTAKTEAEIEKTRAKIAELQEKLKGLEQKKTEQENTEIVDIVRGLSISIDQLPLLLQQIKAGGALGQIGAVDKVPDHYYERKKGNKKDAHRRHPIHLIILFKFKAVAERRQWSSAASKPRRKTRVKLCPHFWAANVPSHQICRLRSASR